MGDSSLGLTEQGVPGISPEALPTSFVNPTRSPRFCRYCGNIIKRRRNNKFCSKRCFDRFITMKVKRICPNCKREFFGSSAYMTGRIYCSIDCRHAGMKRYWSNKEKILAIIICKYCGKSVSIYPPSKGKLRKYCSKECSSLAVVGPRLTTKRFACKFCGEMFIKRNRQRIFCSQNCYTKWKRMYPELLSLYRGGLKIVPCSYCGNSIKRHPNKIKSSEHHFCNYRCYGRYRSEHLRGERNHAYKKSVHNVPCQNCGKPFNKITGTRNKFCSSKCYKEWIKKDTTHAGNWKGRAIDIDCEFCHKTFKRGEYNLNKTSLHHFCSLGCKYAFYSGERTTWKKLNADPEFQKKRLKACIVQPNKKELKLDDILKANFPDQWKYVGDGQIIIGGKNPDFINVNGQKKLIELFGDYWHDPSRRKLIYECTERGRIEHFKKYGFNTLIIWERELKDENAVIERIRSWSN